MKTPLAVALVLSLVAGSASAMTHSQNVVDAVNSANSYGTVSVNVDGSTATLFGSVESQLDAKLIAQAALGTQGVDKVINRITVN